MWRPGAAIASLALALLATTFFAGGERPRPSARQESAPTFTSSKRDCGRAVLRDWVDNEQIDRAYARRCYVLALRRLPEDGHVPEALLTALKGPRDY